MCMHILYNLMILSQLACETVDLSHTSQLKCDITEKINNGYFLNKSESLNISTLKFFNLD